MVRGMAVPNHSRIQIGDSSMELFICRYCGSERKNKNSWLNHERTCPKNLNRKYTPGMLGKTGRDNQYTKAKKLGLAIPDNPRKGKPGFSPPKTPEGLEKLRQAAISRGLGGVTQSRWIEYNGKTLGSSYELILAKSLDENKIKWDTCKKIYYIDPFGKKRSYTPDIYLVDYNVYLDPKNDFLIENINPSLGFSDKEKIKLVEDQNDIRIFILNKNQLEWNTVKDIIKL